MDHPDIFQYINTRGPEHTEIIKSLASFLNEFIEARYERFHDTPPTCDQITTQTVCVVITPFAKDIFGTLFTNMCKFFGIAVLSKRKEEDFNEVTFSLIGLQSDLNLVQEWWPRVMRGIDEAGMLLTMNYGVHPGSWLWQLVVLTSKYCHQLVDYHDVDEGFHVQLAECLEQIKKLASHQ